MLLLPPFTVKLKYRDAKLDFITNVCATSLSGVMRHNYLKRKVISVVSLFYAKTKLSCTYQHSLWNACTFLWVKPGLTWVSVCLSEVLCRWQHRLSHHREPAHRRAWWMHMCLLTLNPTARVRWCMLVGGMQAAVFCDKDRFRDDVSCSSVVHYSRSDIRQAQGEREELWCS